ncbi:hypothetical protein FHJ31_09980 [Pseudomonas sp. Fig-3]|nr:hypothetical protein FHJ31_09980 [Pseudomonas sp. Fig-3]
MITVALTPLWRGDLSPLGRAAALKPAATVCQSALFWTAAQSSGDKSPRHRLCPYRPQQCIRKQASGVKYISQRFIVADLRFIK